MKSKLLWKLMLRSRDADDWRFWQYEAQKKIPFCCCREEGGVICWLMLTHGSVSHPGVFLVWTGLGCVSWRKSWESCVVHMKESEWEGLAVVTSNVDHDRSLCDAKLLSFWRSTCRSHSQRDKQLNSRLACKAQTQRGKPKVTLC